MKTLPAFLFDKEKIPRYSNSMKKECRFCIHVRYEEVSGRKVETCARFDLRNSPTRYEETSSVRHGGNQDNYVCGPEGRMFEAQTGLN